ncbi:heparin lyase I family protein [Pedobacter insulae]|uniref:Polysaccharide lyase n=1 Tax=Pedobacter insulae TaxID=414048 RepID=A0A1I2V433_9SPHI|nr:heparin lyase I family protein [Pedobacter insulae]SFG81871.1 Polysaccharide lyase [Pedobacter insulae]
MKKINILMLGIALALFQSSCKKGNTNAENVESEFTNNNPSWKKGSGGSTIQSIYHNGDASLGIAAVWKAINVEQSGTVTVVNDETGTPVWKFLKPAGSHRAEGHGSVGFAAPEGTNFYVGWRSKIYMPISLQTDAIWQWKSYPTAGSLANHPLMLRTKNGNIELQYFDANHTAFVLWSTPLVTNAWTDFTMRINASYSATTGYVELWYNGVKQTLIGGGQRYYCRTLDSDYCDPKWGVYGGDESQATHFVKRIRIASTYAEAAATPPPAPKVTLYQNCSYGGWNSSLGVGSYTMSQLQALGVINDEASAVKVPAGLKVTLYKSNNFTGSVITLTADEDCLTDIGFNDSVSSLVVSVN